MARGCFPLLFVVCSLTTLPLAAFSEGGVLAKFFAWAWVFLFLLAAWASWRPESRPGWVLGLLLGAFGATCGMILVVIIQKDGISLGDVPGLLVLLVATIAGLASAVSISRRPASGKEAPQEKRTVEFKSAAFPKYENEDDEIINENCWGKRLAEFFRDHLPRYGVETTDILCEDWGWLVFVENDPFSLWVGCGAVDDGVEPEVEDDNGASTSAPPPEGETSGLTVFCAFVEAERGWFKKKVDAEPAVSKVVDAIEQLLADSVQIQDIEWYS